MSIWNATAQTLAQVGGLLAKALQAMLASRDQKDKKEKSQQ